MQMRTPVELGLILRGRRKDLGLSQEALGQRTGVSRQWIVEVEQGKERAELGARAPSDASLGTTDRCASDALRVGDRRSSSGEAGPAA